MFSLSGLDGSVAINGRTVTVKSESAAKVLTAESIRGAAVWTGVLTGQFSIHYVAAPHTAQGKESGAGAGPGAATRVTTSVEYVSVQFKAADKGFWDAMATAIMATARAAASSTAAPSAAKQPADASPSPSPSPEATPPHGFDNWLNRTLGLEQDAKLG